MTQSDIQKTVQNYFLGRSDIHTVILYGSVTEKYFAAESDVDIAVAADHPLSPEERVEIHQALEKLLSRTVDLRDLSTLHGIILHQVLRKGTVLKKENGRYFERKMIEMVDFMQDIYPILEQGMENRLRDFLHG